MSKFKQVAMADENNTTYVDTDKIIGVQKVFFPAKSALELESEQRPHDAFWGVNFIYTFTSLQQISHPAKTYDTEEEADEYIKSIIGEGWNEV